MTLCALGSCTRHGLEHMRLIFTKCNSNNNNNSLQAFQLMVHARYLCNLQKSDHSADRLGALGPCTIYGLVYVGEILTICKFGLSSIYNIHVNLKNVRL